MSTESKRKFRPSLERFEGRVVATAGVSSTAAHHVAAEVHAESHHAPPHKPVAAHPAPSHHPKHAQAKPAHQATPAHPAPTSPQAPQPPKGAAAPPSNPPPPPPTQQSSLPANTTTNQAWVEIVNTTGETIEYYIKLGPYDNDKFLVFDIAPGATQYRYSSLLVNGQRVKPDFAIQFGNGPITPLMTGVSEADAQGYYIFLDGNLAPYVAPFVQS